MVPTVYGERPRPRALFLHVEDPVAQELEAILPTSQRINGLHEVRQTEWDLLITSSQIGRASAHLYVIGFGSTELGRPCVDSSMSKTNSTVGFVASTIATELVVPDNLPKEIEQLVKSDILKTASSSQSHGILMEGYGSLQSHRFPIRPNTFIQPFLATRSGEALAGSFRRKGDEAECWALPADSDWVAWVKLAIDVWGATDPGRFLIVRDWTRSARWQTPREAEAAMALQSLAGERTEVEAKLREQEGAAAEALRAAQECSDLDERALLTEQGDPLVAAVARALEGLGFNVRNMDLELPEGDRREDLRVTDPDVADWEAICEVRGYGRGSAAVSDLMRLQRFAERYAQDEGRPPSACWYVVNQQVTRDPASRPSTILSSNPGELDFFATEYEGLVLDTVVLFDVWIAAQNGAKEPTYLRQLLRGSRGVDFPPVP